MASIISVVLLLALAYRGEAACKCGQERLGTRIIGGIPTTPNRYPWQVGVVTPDESGDGTVYICGGALINDRYVMTAAHCVHGKNARDVWVTLGAHTYSTIATGLFKTPLESVDVHAAYDPIRLTNDIALIKLAQPVKFTDKISPICLPEAQMMNFNNLKVIGWGTVRAGLGIFPSSLMEVSIPQNDAYVCARHWSRQGYRVEDKMQVCAGQSRKDSCGGDSGGPLMTSTGGKMYSVGIVSYGSTNCGDGAPGVYTRTSAFLDWIKARTRDAMYCE